MSWDPTADAWFSGFADGEASFLIVTTGRPPRRPGMSPRFALGLRADDLPVLKQLQAAFGGRLLFNERPQGRADRPANPRWLWHVVAKDDLRRLLDYFDRFPLRAKKAADYAVWREAALLYIARGGVETFSELDALRATLAAGRLYLAPELDGATIRAAFEKAARDG